MVITSVNKIFLSNYIISHNKGGSRQNLGGGQCDKGTNDLPNWQVYLKESEKHGTRAPEKFWGDPGCPPAPLDLPMPHSDPGIVLLEAKGCTKNFFEQ